MGEKRNAGLGFEVLSKEDYLQQRELQLAAIHVEMHIFSSAVPQQKKGVGRPRSSQQLEETLIREVHNVSSSDEEEGSKLVLKKRPRSVLTRPRTYMNWFTAEHWPHIDKALCFCRWKLRETVRYLQHRFRLPNGTGRFESQNDSTIRGWLAPPMRIHYTVKVERAVAAIELSGWKAASRVLHPGGASVWETVPDFEIQFKESLVALRDSQAALNSLFIQLRLRAFLKVHVPALLKENGGAFTISRSFVRKWVRDKLHWTFRRQTSDCSKLPKNWQELGETLKLRISYLVMAHDIPMELVVNADQTGLQLLAVGNEKTYALKGAKSILVSRGGDKRQISLVLACSAAGDLLPSQCIFEGKTKLVVPDGQYPTLLRHMGWHLTQSASHWSTVQTMKDWVNKIFVPWVEVTAAAKGLDRKTVKSILLIDCFSVHRSEEFRTWLKTHHPNVYLLFVPANCTAKLQPCDVILQRHFKCVVQRQFGEYSVAEMAKRLEAGEKPADIRLETSVVVLRKLLCEYLWRAHADISTRTDMIQIGWKKIGLLDAWLKSTQASAAEAAAAGILFDINNVLEVKEEFVAEGDDNWLGDSTVEDVFKGVVECELMTEVEEDMEERPGPGDPTPTLVNFVGTSGGKRVSFTQYLSDAATVTPYR